MRPSKTLRTNSYLLDSLTYINSLHYFNCSSNKMKVSFSSFSGTTFVHLFLFSDIIALFFLIRKVCKGERVDSNYKRVKKESQQRPRVYVWLKPSCNHSKAPEKNSTVTLTLPIKSVSMRPSTMVCCLSIMKMLVELLVIQLHARFHSISTTWDLQGTIEEQRAL